MSVITTDLLKTIVMEQGSEHDIPDDYIPRSLENKLIELTKNKEIIVLTGIRRCGKSVLLLRLRKTNSESDYYFNFEDERLVGFSIEHFQVLYEVFIELFGMQKTFYFDEIQNIPGWEMFVRRLYNSNNKIYITGSNANLFSEELGTRLTGRYIPLHVYPISFYEYINIKNTELLNKKSVKTVDIANTRRLFTEYCTIGGIPEYIKFHNIDYLHAVYDSIIYRDIIARYKLSGDSIIKKLVHYLASNCSKEFTYNSLRKFLGIGSSTTVKDYCGYLENSYFCFFINRYSDSVKAQVMSPKKVYFIDLVIAKTIGFRVSEDFGRVLENLVFLELKRRGYEIYYYKGTVECDFVLRKDGKITQAIQVCKDLSIQKTKQREITGLIEAMNRFKLLEGIILTETEEREEFIDQNKIIILPIWKWLLFYNDNLTQGVCKNNL